MSLSDYKITDAAIAQNGVVAAPDNLLGTAAENKRVFDRLIRDSVKGLFNGLIDKLSGNDGAAEIGVQAITGVTGSKVQAVLESLNTLKSSKSITDKHFRNAAYDAGVYRLTFTREDGTTKSVSIIPSTTALIADTQTQTIYKLVVESGRLELEEV